MRGRRGLRHFFTTLEDGRRVQLFVNRETGLIVVDVVELDDQHGTEVCRVTAPPAWSPVPDTHEISWAPGQKPDVCQFVRKTRAGRVVVRILATGQEVPLNNSASKRFEAGFYKI